MKDLLHNLQVQFDCLQADNDRLAQERDLARQERDAYHEELDHLKTDRTSPEKTDENADLEIDSDEDGDEEYDDDPWTGPLPLLIIAFVFIFGWLIALTIFFVKTSNAVATLEKRFDALTTEPPVKSGVNSKPREPRFLYETHDDMTMPPDPPSPDSPPPVYTTPKTSQQTVLDELYKEYRKSYPQFFNKDDSPNWDYLLERQRASLKSLEESRKLLDETMKKLEKSEPYYHKPVNPRREKTVDEAVRAGVVAPAGPGWLSYGFKSDVRRTSPIKLAPGEPIDTRGGPFKITLPPGVKMRPKAD